MNSLPQRWLSLSGLCTVLNLNPTQVKTLYKQKLLVRIGKRPNEYRYLDPTPEYAERLRLAAVLLTKKSNIDLHHSFILSTREVAEIMGWGWSYARNYLAEKKVPSYQAPNKIRFYSVAAIRNLLWKRNGRRLAGHLGPLLLPEIIAYFQRFRAAEEAVVPTDFQFAEDEALQKKIRWMMAQPNREVLLADFMEKLELAKSAVAALHSPDDTSTCTEN